MSKRDKILFLQAELESSQALVRAYREQSLRQEMAYDQVVADFKAVEEWFRNELARIRPLLPLGALWKPSEPLT